MTFNVFAYSRTGVDRNGDLLSDGDIRADEQTLPEMLAFVRAASAAGFDTILVERVTGRGVDGL